MRKHRSWFMGLGAGIVLGALLLQIITFAENQNDSLDKLNGEITYTQKQLDEAVAKAVADAKASPASSEGKSGSPSPSGSTSPSPTASPSTSPSESPSASASPSSSADADNQQEIVFYVYEGMDLRRVARTLQRLGLVEDAEDFVDASREIAGKIEVGTSRFKGKPTYEEIIAELTRPKDD